MGKPLFQMSYINQSGHAETTFHHMEEEMKEALPTCGCFSILTVHYRSTKRNGDTGVAPCMVTEGPSTHICWQGGQKMGRAKGDKRGSGMGDFYWIVSSLVAAGAPPMSPTCGS